MDRVTAGLQETPGFASFALLSWLALPARVHQVTEPLGVICDFSS
jgi:hypothetical protein